MDDKKTVTLTKEQWEILTHFLDVLSEKYGQAGCNDFSIRNTDNNRQMIHEIFSENDKDYYLDLVEEGYFDRYVNESLKKLDTTDFVVLDHIADKIKSQL